MQLSELQNAAGGQRTGDAEITAITYDSREVKPGCLFVALAGALTDGHDYVEAAARAGAAAVMVERPFADLDAAQLVVSNSREALGKAAARFYDDPSRRLCVIGVTGTNGKTTTTHIIRSIVEASGERAGLIGTISYNVGSGEMPAPNTTPESLVLQRLLDETARAGMRYAAVEVSSHALDQGRANDVHFAAAVFTNLSGEHLDYHKDMPSYARAKGILFRRLAPEAVAVANADDAHTADILRPTKARTVLQYGFARDAEVRVTSWGTDVSGSTFRLATPWGEMALATSMPGKHNVYNCAAAAAVTGALGVTPEAIARGVAALGCVPGRLEPVDEGQPFAVFVDYAHSDDALQNALSAVRPLTRGRVIVVFGCGGDRDPTKRPRMRAVAEELADYCVVTSDNPRSEAPDAIIDQIMRGVRNLAKFTVEADRRLAIREAVTMAKPGDLVLIAGKGHETYQILGERRIHFDDREVAREALREVTSR